MEALTYNSQSIVDHIDIDFEKKYDINICPHISVKGALTTGHNMFRTMHVKMKCEICNKEYDVNLALWD